MVFGPLFQHYYVVTIIDHTYVISIDWFSCSDMRHGKDTDINAC